jgi:hypothetical protein
MRVSAATPNAVIIYAGYANSAGAITGILVLMFFRPGCRGGRSHEARRREAPVARRRLAQTRHGATQAILRATRLDDEAPIDVMWAAVDPSQFAEVRGAARQLVSFEE